MAADLEISASYITLMERNQRPVTAETLLRLAKAYKIDFSDFTSSSGPDLVARLQSAIKDPILSDIDFGPLEIADVAHSFPGFAEAMLRLHTAYREEQFALADQRLHQGGTPAADPISEVRSFLSARRNFFPVLDAASERLAARIGEAGGLPSYFQSEHKVRVRYLPAEVMMGSLRRLDWHRKELLVDEGREQSSLNFLMAQQLAYLEFEKEIQATVGEGQFNSPDAAKLATRAIAAYCAGAIIMPYGLFARAAESRRYDIELLARQFNVSFEQAAHRLTTLQKPGQERIPFFFIKVDPAGNVSKRLNSGSFPFALHGGGCPLWTVHQCFASPRQVFTQWLELPDGKRYFSVAKAFHAGGIGHRRSSAERAVAIVCDGQYADRLVYNVDHPQTQAPTPIGIACQICHRTECVARSEPPLGRQILPDSYRRMEAPFGFSDT